MITELDLIKDVANLLTEAGVEYMITGSMAMAVYAVPRMTRDIDMVIHVTPGDAGKIVSLFHEDYYIDETNVQEAIQTRGMFNIIHNESIIKVDFIVRKDDEYRITEFSRKRQMEIEEGTVWVVAPEDLILSKLVWAKQSDSRMQLNDANQILAGVTSLDDDYLESWSQKLDVNDLLNEIRNYG